MKGVYTAVFKTTVFDLCWVNTVTSGKTLKHVQYKYSGGQNQIYFIIFSRTNILHTGCVDIFLVSYPTSALTVLKPFSPTHC